MTTRRRSSPDEATYHRRQMEREEDKAVVEALGDRMETFFGRVDSKLEEIRYEVRRLDQKHDGLSNRVQELEMQIAEAREAVYRARAATPSLTVTAGRQVVAEVKKSWVAKAAAASIAVMACWTLYRALPEMARGVDHLWDYIRTADEPYKGKPADEKH